MNPCAVGCCPTTPRVFTISEHMGAAFLQQWLKSPTLIGAIAPSSRYLAQVMACHADGAQAIVELGAGTGIITAELARRFPGTPLLVFEQNPVLANRLHGRFPHTTIIGACFHTRTDLLDQLPKHAVFVSSLPFRSLPLAIKLPTIRTLQRLLLAAPQRRLVQFTYQPRPPFKAPAGLIWRRCATVWRNAPPAGVWELLASGQELPSRN
jgi:phosphatidylethanolamine/phosphatidyl-N-methylethanolamine N-methyltransferase